MKKKLLFIPLIITIIGGIIGGLLGLTSVSKPAAKNIIVKARQYAYIPEKLEVNAGDTLHIKLISLDVVHGFYVEGYDIDAEIQANLQTIKYRHPSEGYNWKEANEIVLIANKTGKFRYRCSHTCGTMHPFMQGALIVKPNTPLNAGIGGTAGFMVGMLLMLYLKIRRGK